MRTAGRQPGTASRGYRRQQPARETFVYMYDGGGRALLPPKYPPRHKTITLRLASRTNSSSLSAHRSSRGRPATSSALWIKHTHSAATVCVCAMTATHRPCFAFIHPTTLRECAAAVLTKFNNLSQSHRKTLRMGSRPSWGTPRYIAVVTETYKIMWHIAVLSKSPSSNFVRVTFVKDEKYIISKNLCAFD